MMIKNKLMLSVLLAILLPFSVIYAQSFNDGGQRSMHGVGGPGDMSSRMFRGLDLSDEQKDDIRAITDAAKPELGQLMGELREKQHALNEIVKSGAVDDSQLQSLSDEIGQSTAALSYQQARLQAGIYSVLTEDQLDQLNQQRESMRDGMKDRSSNKRRSRD
jgi:Spy/CpxP family protein refolding chaperone